MNIPINDEWRIESDEHCWAIIRRYETLTGENAGKVRWTAIRWFPTLKQAVNGLFELRLRLSGADTMVKAIEDAKSIAAELHEAFTLGEDNDHAQATR